MMILEALKAKNMDCTGCSACINSCPTGAISSEKDCYGFLYPTINASKCICCNKCVAVCPVINFSEEKKPPLCCYMIIAENDIRALSSSGGAFTALARVVLENNGVVFGAAINDDLTVCHREAHSEAELKPLQKSKYVQSIMGNAMQKVKTYLENGRDVLFAGCPCQVAGLRSYLGRAYKNLWTVDVICHGVPSAQMLQDSLSGIKNISSIDFRDKNYGWECMGMTVIKQNGSRQRLSYNESRYEQGFHPNITLRESCYNCKFCEFPRQGDVSIGDFWNVKAYCPEVDDKNGVSAVLVNTEHGSKLLEASRKYLELFQKIPQEWLNSNRLQAEICKPKERKAFLRLYPQKEFNKAFLYAQQNIHDIGIVGNWSYPNYGTALTYYALYYTLCRMGYTVAMLSWPKDAPWKPYEKAALFKKNPYPLWDVEKIPEHRWDLYQYNNRCKTFILGSDQLLNNNLYNAFARFVQMDWVKGNRKKIAYSASFGTDYIWGEDSDRAEMAYFLQKFDSFSVREASGKELLHKYYGVTAQVVLDPVFLLPDAEYKRLIADGEERVPRGEYVFTYILDQTDEKQKQVQRCVDWLGIPMRSVSDAAPDAHQINIYREYTEYNVFLEEWLAFINNSKAVITDSFHGTCMSILAQKPFLALCNDARGAARFRALLKLFDLEERLCESANELIEKRVLLKTELNTDMISRRIECEKAKSVQWLKEALVCPQGHKSFSTYDILGEGCDKMSAQLNESLVRVNGLEQLQRESVVTEEKQWGQLEDHRLRLDGVDAKDHVQDIRIKELERQGVDNVTTDEKQWEQLEDHRLRLDGVDARNGEQDDRINRLEQDYKKSVVTEKKQWDQLEDHRLRLDGIDAKDKATREALGQMSHMIQELEQQNSILKEQVDTGEQNIALLEQQLQQLKKWSFMYWLRRIFKGKS